MTERTVRRGQVYLSTSRLHANIHALRTLLSFFPRHQEDRSRVGTKDTRPLTVRRLGPLAIPAGYLSYMSISMSKDQAPSQGERSDGDHTHSLFEANSSVSLRKPPTKNIRLNTFTFLFRARLGLGSP